MIIYHITSNTEWQKALALGQYTAPSLFSEGFIHASTQEQVPGTAKRYFAGQTELVLLVIDPARIKAEVRFDPVTIYDQPTTFPHIYGPINLDAVQEALPFDPALASDFPFPRAQGE